MGNCFGLKRKSKTVDRNEDISSIISNGAPPTCPTASAMHPDMETALRHGEDLVKDLSLGNNGACTKARSEYTTTKAGIHCGSYLLERGQHFILYRTWHIAILYNKTNTWNYIIHINIISWIWECVNIIFSSMFNFSLSNLSMFSAGFKVAIE